MNVEEDINNNEAEQIKIMQQLQYLEKVAKTMMSKDAISRYGNLKIAHPEIAIKTIAALAAAVQSGNIRQAVTDEQFKGILKEIQNK